jgi:hypothetical protein
LYVTAGRFVTFVGRITKGSPAIGIEWSFDGGTPSTHADTIRTNGGNFFTPAVRYDSPGRFIASFTGVDSDGKQCGAETTVEVVPARERNKGSSLGSPSVDFDLPID